MIDLSIHKEQLERSIERARERDIIIPTYAQMKDPSLTPDPIKARLAKVGLWDVDSLIYSALPGRTNLSHPVVALAVSTIFNSRRPFPRCRASRRIPAWSRCRARSGSGWIDAKAE